MGVRWDWAIWEVQVTRYDGVLFAMCASCAHGHVTGSACPPGLVLSVMLLVAQKALSSPKGSTGGSWPVVVDRAHHSEGPCA